MQAEHRVWGSDARKLDFLQGESVHLVVTSPPYPMIEMWDSTFIELNPETGEALQAGEGWEAFALMHRELDRVWKEVYRVLKPGGFACVNVGDATRTLAGRFLLYANHARIISAFQELGFDVLPLILWRKQTNAPNKFMGSGMLPAGAYITLEHEYILVFRKGGKRVFPEEKEKFNRRESAIFWEERNLWYSDIWDFKGIRQDISSPETGNNLRKRSGAFPFLLPFRLVNMFSVYGDTVLDPFLGTGTTTLAAVASGRNSLGVEINPGFVSALGEKMTRPEVARELNEHVKERYLSHLKFVEEYTRQKGGSPGHSNCYYGFPVVTGQETRLKLMLVETIKKITEGRYRSTYHPLDSNSWVLASPPGSSE